MKIFLDWDGPMKEAADYTIWDMMLGLEPLETTSRPDKSRSSRTTHRVARGICKSAAHSGMVLDDVFLVPDQ